MRLATYESDGAWTAAILAGERLVPIAGAAERAGLDQRPASRGVRAVLAEQFDALAELDEAASQLAGDGGALAASDARLGPPVTDPQKILCVGLNYREHAGEAKLDEPEVPLIFAKFANALIGPGAPILLPKANPDRSDYECEVAVVIGRRAFGVSESEALDHVAGWTVLNDVSARDLQTQTSQWTVGKGPDTFAPCGPYLAIDDALRDGGLELETRLNGERMQHAHTDQMIFSVAELVSYLSQTMTLEPGDIIATGTPEGVGAHREPPVYLADGDEISCRVGDQELTNPVARRDG